MQRSISLLFYSSLAFISTSILANEDDLQLSGRLRVASVDTSPKDARAASLKLRVNWQHDWLDDWSSVMEIDGIASTWRAQHSDGVHLNEHPLIPDPPGVELNQLAIRHDLSSWRFIVGRQRIEWDNQRFVGSNAFWQNDQTFDAATAQWRFGDASQLQYSYLQNVNRIFGDDADKTLSASESPTGAYGNRPVGLLGNHRMDSHLLHLRLKEWDSTEVSAYALWLRNLTVETQSQHTAGARFKGDWKIESLRYHLELERAYQKRTAFDDDWKPYSLITGSIAYHAFELALRAEQLASRDNVAFITPLGSTHDFHGSVAKFSTPPADGLREYSTQLHWRAAPWQIQMNYMRFSNANGDEQYGHEWDSEIRYKLNRQHALNLSIGKFYSSSVEFNDETRLYLDYSFEL